MSAVLVVGSPGSGKKTLVQGLVRLLRAGPGPTARDAAEGQKPEASTPTALVTPKPDRRELIEQAGATFDIYSASVATKYYIAQVALWRQAQASVPVLALRSAEKLEGLEGVIVLFDLGQESSFAEAAQWAAFVDDREQCAFRVCVGSKLDLVPENNEEAAGGSGYGEEFSPPPEATAPAEKNGGGGGGGSAAAMAEGVQDRRARCLEWCLDHGFEYVEADCRDLERGGGGREKEGVPRIVEALQSNVWTGMEFCTDSRPSLMPAAAAAGSSRNVGDADADGTFSERDGEGAKVSSSTGRGEQEVSEYLAGFVDGDDGLGEYAGYGALDSGGEDEDDGENEDEGAEDGGPGGRKTGREPAEAGDTSGIAAIAAGEEGSEEGGGCVEGGDGGVVDPAHIELQGRWEQRDSGCPPPSAAPAGGEAATRQHESGQALPEPVRESAPAHDGDERNKVGAAVKPGDAAATSACLPSNGSTGASGSDGGEGGCGEGGDTGGEGGAGEVVPSATKSEENPLKSAGSMVEGLGGDFEGGEMEQLMSEVRKARELGSSVPDAERRARAADVAMRLAALLGELGDDSGDDDDDER